MKNKYKWYIIPLTVLLIWGGVAVTTKAANSNMHLVSEGVVIDSSDFDLLNSAVADLETSITQTGYDQGYADGYQSGFKIIKKAVENPIEVAHLRIGVTNGGASGTTSTSLTLQTEGRTRLTIGRINTTWQGGAAGGTKKCAIIGTKADGTQDTLIDTSARVDNWSYDVSEYNKLYFYLSQSGTEPNLEIGSISLAW